jgi:O-antigen ligase
LLVPIAALTAFLMRTRALRRQCLLGGLLALHALALLLTFSRSAWLAAGVVVGLVVWWQYSSPLVRSLRRWWVLGVALLLLIVVAGFTQRNNQFVSSYITHSTPEVVEDLDSNQYHWLFVRQGLDGIAQQPLGHGPGTAGIVSIKNPNGSFLTENYYVQIGYEVGVIGLALFIALLVLVYTRLRARHDYVGAVLMASFWGYVITNMLLHTWSNEAVAAQWWLLAGLALLLPVKSLPRK